MIVPAMVCPRILEVTFCCEVSAFSVSIGKLAGHLVPIIFNCPSLCPLPDDYIMTDTLTLTLTFVSWLLNDRPVSDTLKKKSH